jgi:hypothetical protein
MKHIHLITNKFKMAKKIRKYKKKLNKQIDRINREITKVKMACDEQVSDNTETDRVNLTNSNEPLNKSLGDFKMQKSLEQDTRSARENDSEKVCDTQINITNSKILTIADYSKSR